MKYTNILDLPDEKLKEIFLEKSSLTKKPLVKEELVDKALEYYKDKFITPFQSLSITPSEDYKFLQSKTKATIKDAYRENFWSYPENRVEISELYQETKNWDEVISKVVYTDENTSPEAFIDEVEAIYNTKVKDAKHLQKLTGCMEYEKKAKYKLQDVINMGRYSTYFRALSIILDNGGTYSDLLKVEPKEYGLPETWEGTLGKNKASSISWAIALHFCLDEVGHNLLPKFRYYAEDLKAPLSVIMDAYFTINGIKK